MGIKRARTRNPPIVVEPAVETGTDQQPEGSGWGTSVACARKVLEEALPSVARKLAEEGLAGSLPHIKLLFGLLGLEDGGLEVPDARPAEKTLEEVLMEQWRKEP